MTRHLVHRLAETLLVLAAMSLVFYTLIALMPGDPIDIMVQADPKLTPSIAIGVSPRAAQALVKAARVRALVSGRYAVGFKDIVGVARPALRHRIRLSFEAEAEGMTTDDIIERLLDHVPRERDDATLS